MRTIAAGDLEKVAHVIAQGRVRFGLDATAPVVSCYEAGRDGFWIHRALVALGVANRVVDSSSIEVNRRARRAKTDRIDAVKLVQMLVRAWCGERTVWSEVRVPTVAAEAARQVESGADGADARAHPVAESDAGVAGDVGHGGAAAADGGVVDDGAGLGGD